MSKMSCNEINTGEYMKWGSLHGRGNRGIHVFTGFHQFVMKNETPCQYNFTFSLCYFAEELPDQRWSRLACITSSTRDVQEEGSSCSFSHVIAFYLGT
jgi:hypothetical protein